jgi:hypothetical protein
MKAIKREIANLCPDRMFQDKALNLETKPESKTFEDGSILRLSGLPSQASGLSKRDLSQAFSHFGRPAFVDVTNVRSKNSEALVRFANSKLLNAFLSKAANKSTSPSEEFTQAIAVQLRADATKLSKVKLEVLSQADTTKYSQVAQKQQ